MSNIVVLGAGVSGLTTALHLLRNGHNVSIIAKHMPGDYDAEYCSPWAGANYVPNLAASQAAKSNEPGQTSTSGKAEILAFQLERDTWPELERLARELPETGIHFQEFRSLKRAQDAPSVATTWFDELFADPTRQSVAQRSIINSYRKLATNELADAFDNGISFNSVCINTAIYLPWLASQCLKLGGTLRRAIVTHVKHAADLHHSGKTADLIINCTGLSSRHLGGVEDQALYPVRGQVVVVRNDPGQMYSISGNEDGKEESTYIMNRGAGGGCILGGCSQPNNWESQPDPNLAIRIMKRCVEACPDLVPNGKGIEGLSVVRHGVGLRPMRKGSIRLEKKIIDGVRVVHNYGHGGCGYQTSYGCAEVVKKLVDEFLLGRAHL